MTVKGIYVITVRYKGKKIPVMVERRDVHLVKKETKKKNLPTNVEEKNVTSATGSDFFFL